MANTTQNSPNGFTVLSQFLFKLFMNILILGVIAFLMSLIASVAYTKLPQKWLDVLASPFTWITQNPWLALAIFIIFLLLIAIFYLMSRSSGSVAEPSQTVRVEFVPPPPPAPVPLAPTPKLAPTERELALAYCNHINKRNERLEHDGIPAGLVDRRVKLEDVFIPLRFYRLDAPRDIFPYMDADLAHVRRERELVAQQGGDIRAYNRIIELARQEGDFKPDKTIDIATLWQCMTPHEPMAFIEGIPGMGKSTLLTRIMLYMARRVQNIADPDMPALAPILIPVFVSLKKYATERNTPTNKLSLLDFIKTDIREKFHDRDEVDALIAFIERQLKSGYCLVLIDGIDEVSDPAMRQTVQVAIKDFIERRQEKATATYNRFLITSRVAGYDKKGFEDYPHYLIARLTLEQMKDFLPRWCHANVSRDMRDESEEDIRREADEITQILIKTVENNAPVRELAEIPLLLTLLAALQQKGATLPDRCAGLYKLVVNTLLTDRNKAKKLETLSVADAHQRLGPLVYEMHTHNSLALDEDYIHQKLAEAIHAQQGKSQQTPIDASEEMEAKSYLNRLSERGGLFVKRAGNYYDFSHRSFEEYFTAQYLLRQIELNQQEGIQDFIERIVHNYSLWREPYLLAVASKSENDSTTGGTTASKLIQALLQSPLTSTDLNLLLLTATAIIEAEPNSIDLTLQRQIADVLLKRYTEALRAKKFEDCKRIEQTMTRWLLTLPKDAFRPPVLLSLLDHILNASQTEQRATLKLLAMVMPDILTGSPQIFDTLMPVLLAIAGLPAVIGNERTVEPASNISMSSDPLVRDYAFTALSVMGRRGPGGLLLSKIREEVEPYLEHMAYYSLDCGTLITPTNIPLTEEKYVSYEKAIAEWIQLQNELEKRPHTGADVKRCAAIHKALLTHAEEVNYAMAPMIASMLAASAHSSEPWKKIWTNMLLNQLQAQQDIAYFNAALLWTALFIERDALKQLAEQLKQDYRKASKHISAARFIAYLAEDFRHFRHFRYSRYSRYSRYFRYFRYFQDFQDFRGLRGFRGFLFTNEIVQISSQRLKQASLDEQVDLLLILLGRILQIGEDAPDTSPEQKTQQEIHYIVQQITPFCTSTNDDVRDAALDILPYLPVRTEHEIRFVIEGAEQAKDGQVRDAYCDALRRARPLKSEWDMLKRMGMQSQVKGVRAATEEAMKRRR